jgi:hypothetical protein
MTKQRRLKDVKLSNLRSQSKQEQSTDIPADTTVVPDTLANDKADASTAAPQQFAITDGLIMIMRNVAKQSAREILEEDRKRNAEGKTAYTQTQLEDKIFDCIKVAVTGWLDLTWSTINKHELEYGLRQNLPFNKWLPRMAKYLKRKLICLNYAAAGMYNFTWYRDKMDGEIKTIKESQTRMEHKMDSLDADVNTRLCLFNAPRDLTGLFFHGRRIQFVYIVAITAFFTIMLGTMTYAAFSYKAKSLRWEREATQLDAAVRTLDAKYTDLVDALCKSKDKTHSSNSKRK